jgi:hypothetical protein
MLIVLFVSVLHLVDSKQAYRLASNETAEIWKKLPNSLSADDLAKLQGLLAAVSPSGITGTTRSILTYSLIIILGIAVFHLLALPPAAPNLATSYADYADKILILLAGSLTTAVGFYFGAKATADGVAAAKPQDGAQPSAPSGQIERVEPDHGAPGAMVVIKGTGFGNDRGNVQFGDVAVGTIDNWSETSIKVKVPDTGLAAGKVDVTVNPAHGSKIVGPELFTVEPPAPSPHH